MDSDSHPYVIDANAEGSARETAVLLVGTAVEYDLDPATDIQRITRPEPGFRITEALAEALGSDLDEADSADEVPVPAPEPDLSGNKQPLAPDHDIHGEPVEDAYADWDYADLKAAVKTRGIDTEDQKQATLIAALKADDETLAADTESDESDN